MTFFQKRQRLLEKHLMFLRKPHSEFQKREEYKNTIKSIIRIVLTKRNWDTTESNSYYSAEKKIKTLKYFSYCKKNVIFDT